MPKVQGPLLSLSAKGRFASTLAFAKFPNSAVVRFARVKYFPRDPRSNIQLFNRDFFSRNVNFWQAFTTLEKKQFDVLAKKEKISGFNFFVQIFRAQKPTILGNFRPGFSALGDLIL